MLHILSFKAISQLVLEKIFCRIFFLNVGHVTQTFLDSLFLFLSHLRLNMEFGYNRLCGFKEMLDINEYLRGLGQRSKKDLDLLNAKSSCFHSSYHFFG